MLEQTLERRATSRVGTVLREKYRIDRVIGVGGMATVYAAVHRNGSRVAIKALHEELSVRGDMRARFLREGYVANMVGHPGAVRVLDDDIAEDGSAFLVMELLTGETLRAFCKRRGGRLPFREVLALGHQLLAVLGAAHIAGIVHRDIKPENLFLTTDRALKVLDFGIARIEDDPNALATATGTRLGTPAFMPPELALGRTAEIDGRTDLWSAGATMFQLISGQIVHEASGAAEIVVRAATVPARSLAAAAPDVPAEVAALVDRALRFARDDRWATARAMQEAIEQAHIALFAEPIRPFDQIEPPLPAPLSTRDALQATTLSAAPEPGATRGGAGFGAAGSTTLSPHSTRSTSDPRWGSDSGQGSRSVDVPLASQPSMSPTVEAANTAGPARSLRKRASSPRKLAAGALAIALAGGAALFFTRRASAPSAPGASDAQSAAAASAQGLGRGCVTNRECAAKSEGKPSICRKSDGACVALETEQCKVLASPGDVENDATVWLGAMFPISYSELNHDGPQSGKVLELARRDFATMTGGLLPVRPGAPKRPIAVVLCDDREAPEPAAQHLVNDVRVPAILGFAMSKEVMELSASLFNPNGVLALAANTGSMLREIPRSPSGERLVWRVTTSVTEIGPATAGFISSVIEPDIRAQPGALAPGEPIRMALVRIGNASIQSAVDALTATLRINGKPVTESSDQFRRIEVDSGRSEEGDPKAVAQIIEFKPHLIAYFGAERMPSMIEASWPRASRFRPRHFTATTFLADEVETALRKNADFRRRFYALDAASPPDLLSSLLLRYNEVFTPKATSVAAAAYDAFYLFAYAASTLGAEPITGPALARALPRLQPGGTPIGVGPSGIYQAFYALAEGKNIDLRGIQTSLDFDLKTGDATADYELYCVSLSADGQTLLKNQSGLFFRSARGALDGAYRCP